MVGSVVCLSVKAFSFIIILLFSIISVAATWKKFLQPLTSRWTIAIKERVTERLYRLLFSSVHGPIEEEENDGDGASLYAGVGDGRPAQGDGCVHAGAGGRPAAEADGPREGNAEQSNESAGRHARADQPRKPRETAWTRGQDTLSVPFTFSTFRPLTDTSCASDDGVQQGYSGLGKHLGLSSPPADECLRPHFFCFHTISQHEER